SSTTSAGSPSTTTRPRGTTSTRWSARRTGTTTGGIYSASTTRGSTTRERPTATDERRGSGLVGRIDAVEPPEQAGPDRLAAAARPSRAGVGGIQDVFRHRNQPAAAGLGAHPNRAGRFGEAHRDEGV